MLTRYLDTYLPWLLDLFTMSYFPFCTFRSISSINLLLDGREFDSKSTWAGLLIFCTS